MPIDSALSTYLERYFVSLDTLAELAGVGRQRVVALIEGKVIPGPIYSLWPNGACWSPIGGAYNGSPAGVAVQWYTPAAAWWIRRAAALAPVDAARALEDRFVADFSARLPRDPDAVRGYPQAGDAGRLTPDRIAAVARAEWADWIGGGYGVCLRLWTAEAAIAKTCRRAAILELTDKGRRPSLPPETLAAVLDAMEALDAVMLPFAPHQRPFGTPGLWIDALLARYGLGRMRETARAGAVAPGQECA